MLNRTEPTALPGPGADAAGADGAPLVLDAGALDKLRALDPGGRSGVLLRVLGTFEGSLKRLMTQFDAARAANDLVMLRHVAHTLRSSSASIGALALSRECLEVETRIREGRTDDMAPALDAMAAESGRAAAAVRAMLDAPGKPA
jgi:HPt (histidine-containing phosphotransfer) domain-containing protein